MVLYKVLNIAYSLGHGCNLSCPHCCVNSGPDCFVVFNKAEADLFVSEIRLHRPENLLFTGGEPTLYLDRIAYVIERCKDVPLKHVGMTTNGHFLVNSDGFDLLRKIANFTFIQLSCGLLYNNFIDVKKIDAFAKICKKQNIVLSLNIPIAMPEDMLLYDAHLSLGLPTSFTKIIASGRAKNNNLYFKSPRFDESVLNKKCSQDIITYRGGAGFSMCCGNLVRNNVVEAIHKTIAQHVESPFFKRVTGTTFGEFAAEVGVKQSDLKSFHSLPCHLCEYLFSKLMRSQYCTK